MELLPGAQAAPLPSERDWSELPLDVLTLVFAGLGAVEVLMDAGFVCHSWLEAAKAPGLWRKVDMGRGPRDKEVMEKRGTDLDDPNQVMCAVAKVAVDRSDGKLEVFVGEKFVTDEILNYIGARSPSLKKLALLSCHHVTSEGFYDLVTKCPQLEDIEVSGCVGVRGDAILATGRACLRLKRLVLDKTLRRKWDRKEVAGISLMHELRYLSLARSEITNEELMAVVHACPCLEYLSVVDCDNIVPNGVLRAKCATVKMLELPTSIWMSSMDVRRSGMFDGYYDKDQDDDTAFYPRWISDDDDGRCHNYGLDDDLDPDYDLYPYYDYGR